MDLSFIIKTDHFSLAYLYDMRLISVLCDYCECGGTKKICNVDAGHASLLGVRVAGLYARGKIYKKNIYIYI